MNPETTPNEETAESKNTPGLNRRAFLQTAGAAAGLAASAGALGSMGGLSTPAQAQDATTNVNFPMPPKLVARPLKASTLATTGISRKTHEEHFKLYQGYVNKSNELFGKIATVSRDPKLANQTYSEIRELKVELSFALGGVKNHELYFDILGRTNAAADAAPKGPLLREINRSFGSVVNWAADLKATGIGARGWVWTAYDNDLNRLMNYIGDAQNTYPMWNSVPILGLDVYEHAYYLDFATNRGAYIDAFMQNINWSAVNTRFMMEKKSDGSMVTLSGNNDRDGSIGITIGNGF